MKFLRNNIFTAYIATLIAGFLVCLIYPLVNVGQNIPGDETIKEMSFSSLASGMAGSNDIWLLATIAFATLLVGSLISYFLLECAPRRSGVVHMSEEEEMFRLAIEGTKDGVFDWDIQSGEVYYSHQFMEMLGYGTEDLTGTPGDFSDKIDPEEREAVWNHINLYLRGELSDYSTTFRMRHKSGHRIWIKARGILIRDKKASPMRFVGALTDISATKEYEITLQDAMIRAEEANKAKSDFLAHMSHEIRTPLTAITGVAEILAEYAHELDDKKQKLVKVLYSSSVSLKDLISDILDFSKIENGELELEEKPFYLQDAFEHIASVMIVRMREKNLDFAFSYAGLKDQLFYGDPVRIRQILINLIGNALKFTENGHVHVKAAKENVGEIPVLRVDVEDTGIGVAEDEIDMIFEHFKQGDSSISRKFGGTGLGLPISKKLAGLMGGNIEVKSEAGKGSTFSLIIPFVERKDKISESEVQKKAMKKKHIEELKAQIEGSQKILLVEDYEGNVTVLGHILEDMGIEFDVARTGLEAVDQWKENHYSLILMDIQMPEMDGISSARHIRGIEKEMDSDRTPIVGMTAHAMVDGKAKCLAAGMDAYILKPIDEIDFKATVLKYMSAGSLS
ncbi:MAG: ATP-binding protein [Sneathiella sp.]